MEQQKKYKNCVKNSQKELRIKNKFVIIRLSARGVKIYKLYYVKG